ncbi:ABC transporter permease [Pseudocnuella soli]|uniref:ABC transporter permease n=1 Tax=Pseudocnuella soli TaxID=2502779 RepID=UPI0010507B48|nr:ABC transporter permease [Pseudocnuella soli]
MSQQYSQWCAMLAITRASMRAIFRSPSSVGFSIFFPLVLILVFGFIGGGGGPTYRIYLSPQSDTANEVVAALRASKSIRFAKYADTAELQSDLVKGRITGIVDVQRSGDSSHPYNVQFRSTTASGDKTATFLPFLENTLSKIDRARFANRPTYAQLHTQIDTVREYRTIDFILPGQLGFSLLSAGVFGVAFLFYSLRQQLVLKRFYATPIRRTYIVLGEGLARVIFQMTTAIIIIGIGYFAFNFTLINGWITFLEIMVLCFLALLVFMAFGFIVSSLAKSENLIPPLANIVTLPQFLLAGTFFSIDVFPKWLQPISMSLPLTHFNDAMRRIAFEGAHLTDCGLQLAVLAGWGVVAYAVAVKVFRWE